MQNGVEGRFKRCTLAAPDRILVATDFSDMEYLLPHAIAQARAGGSEVTLVHAVSPYSGLPTEAGAVPSYVDRTKMVRDARVMLLGVVRQIESRGISCNTAVREGLASDVIHEELRRADATRLILGTHGRGRLGQLALGSVAQELISTVNIPVFAVGPHASDVVQHATPRNILHPVSLMGDYQESVDLALDIAQTYRSELTLLYVLDPDVADSTNPERILDWARNALDALTPDATALMPPVHTLVTTGQLTEEVLKAALQTNADWVVLGSDGDHRFGPINASTASKLLTSATCPVLSFRHEPYRTGSRKLEVTAQRSFAPSIARA
ncbi:universal stress protein [Terracidiphilus sp.]|jgi:nucleotide-binding universal stress UspA family protein|uniref:universal stress protein n=1 Tax=Terracidiphilus sp. TaxID=1964191 RepID=UPI003C15E9FB